MVRSWDEALALMLRGDLRWPGGLDPARFIERCTFHGITAVIQTAIESGDRSKGWPKPVLDALVADTRRQAAVELARRHELVRLLPQLAGAGTQPILLKGCALAHTIYARPYLRPVVDADLLVHPAQRARAFEILRDEGYETTAYQGGNLVNAQVSYWRTLPSGVPLTLDVHWRISTSPLFAHVLEFDDARARASPVPQLGPAALGLSPADALLHACVHRAPMLAPIAGGDAGRENRSNRLIWLYDVHLLAAALGSRGWSPFVQQVTQHRLRGICLDALEAAAHWLGTAIPGEVRAALALAAGSEPSMALLSGSAWRLKWAEMVSLPRLAERLLYLRETALPAPAYMLERYDTRQHWLLPALYLRRACEGLLKMAFPRGFEPLLHP